MPISGIEQPELLQIGPDLRLRRFDGRFDFAIDWYQDEETLYLVDGKREPYTMERLESMYHYLGKRGELYFIEAARGERFLPVGDVTFSRTDLPIVIGERAMRGRGSSAGTSSLWRKYMTGMRPPAAALKRRDSCRI